MTKNLGTFNGSAILSNTSKMPGYSISTPAQDCKTGAKLAKVKGSVCSSCYALKGTYNFPSVKVAMQNRQAFMASPKWVDLMVATINRTRSPWFRWFDSGDVQSVKHALGILKVCKATPSKTHWIPTKEKAIWRKALAAVDLPDNVTLRLSAAMVDGEPPKGWNGQTSTVDKDRKAIGHPCPAPTQGGKCQDCRACWSRDVPNVSYHAH